MSDWFHELTRPFADDMVSRRAEVALLVILSCWLALGPMSRQADARTDAASSYVFTVTTTADTHDAHPGDGVCADQQGKCSLRAATEEADGLPKGNRITITVPKGTYTLVLGTLALTANSVSMIGASRKTTIINDNHAFTVVQVTSGVVASLTGFTIEGGSTTGNGGGIDNEGGTVSVSYSTLSHNTASSGGGIYNTGGTVSISSSTLRGNSATSGFTGDYGGGIYNESGTMTVSQSTVNSNSVMFCAGCYGGGIANGGTMTVSRSTISTNSITGNPAWGSGIYNNGTLTVSESTLSHNVVHGGQDGSAGGGIGNYEGSVTVSQSTISGNSAKKSEFGSFGGAISTYQATQMTITNSTLSGNSAIYGGGIDNEMGPLTITNSTLSGNQAHSGDGSGIRNISNGTITLTATIMANSPGGSNCSGAVTEGAGYNLDSGTSCGFSLQTDLTNTDPKLGPLGNYGGPTQTMVLLPGSPAIDWVALSSCAGGLAAVTDQRGYARPDNQGESACDIGAYESSY